MRAAAFRAHPDSPTRERKTMNDAVPQPADPVTATRTLVRAVSAGGLAGLLRALRYVTGADAVIVDTAGNTLASAPPRELWDIDAILEPSHGAGLTVRDVLVDGERTGLIAVRATAERLRGGIADVAADLAGVELRRLLDSVIVRREIAAGLLDDILKRRLSDGDAASRFESLGLDPSAAHRVLLGSTQLAPGRRSRLAFGGVHLARDPFLRITYGDHALMIVPDDPMTSRIADTFLQQMQALGRGARVGVSRPRTGPVNIRASYYEALTALERGDGVHYPDRVDLGQLLLISATDVPVAELATQLLEPLAEHDRDHGSDLVTTLRGYLEADRNVVTATAQLYIHRNTLRNRLQKIEELLGVDLEGSGEIANLWLALRALDDARDPGRIVS